MPCMVYASTPLLSEKLTISPGAQMVMTDVSGSKDRADALGKLGVAYGVGMVVGPPIGGRYNYQGLPPLT